MRIDLTRMPVVEIVVGFLLAALAVTFIAAFSFTGGDGEEAVTEPTPTPAGPTPPVDGNIIAVSMGDNFFEPSEITVNAGETVTFDITNDGAAIHNMHIAGPDGQYAEAFCSGDAGPCSDPNMVLAGQTATVVWEVPDEAGEFPFRCDFHPVDMTGTITVQ